MRFQPERQGFFMGENTFFMHRIRRVNGEFNKGIEIYSTFDGAKQAFHAQMSAWGYGHDATCDYVSCMITDISGSILNPFNETWIKPAEPEPEPTPEPEPEVENNGET